LVSKSDLGNARIELGTPLREDGGIIQLPATTERMKVGNEQNPAWCFWNFSNLIKVGPVAFNL
jgi:hypothetical protein